MNEFIQITEENFNQQVLASEQPVLLEFGAPWCSPCRRLEPLLIQLVSEEWRGKIRLAKADVDDCPNLVLRHSVMTVPTLVLYIGSQPVQQMTGFQGRGKILEKFDPFLSNPPAV